MTDQPRFELFAFWRTSATYRVRVAMNLKGVQARETQINLIEGQQHDPAFLRVNPMAAIPALIDRDAPGSAPLTQSLAILEFLEETAPTPPILPQDSHARARVRSLALLLAADTHPFVVPRVRKYLTAHAGFDDAKWKEWQVNWFSAGLQGLEKRLAAEPGTGRFCHGDTVTMADICMASIVVVTRIFGIKVADIPTVDRIMATCEAMPAFADADPMRQVGAPA